jgi:proline iminopeptidase
VGIGHAVLASDLGPGRAVRRSHVRARVRASGHAYVHHDAWLAEDELLRGLGKLDGIPAVLVQGRFDFQAPLGSAWAVHRAWTGSELVVVEDAGHDAGAPAIEEEIVRATDRFAI